MPCVNLGNMIICTSPVHKLRLSDGRSVWMESHGYCGPLFYRDRKLIREIEEWWEDGFIIEAFDWWNGRGRKG